ncbi:CRISPR-associated helicase Cas3' [Methanohalophilus sp. WG1-DM]|uniref:CRISPR-associated helicase Cas3' n=1 Tax=Methanohalophilus sp. WG1-DM TaxID=2491675 RepID=UPI000FFEF17A|nr:CRISPR-associated helicase Cas3' [Methanohalophilus sp. WG1-DM]RXG34139.1 hypothetical protein CI957_1249 [Methanohalophilus sp. WG1-DM]
MKLSDKTFSFSNEDFNLKSHPHQSLKEHLEGVTSIALGIFDKQTENSEKREAIKKICMAHDFGKATSFFQDYITYDEKSSRQSRKFGTEKNHSLLSAIFAYWWLPEPYKLMGYLAIKRHHGSIKNTKDETELLDEYDILEKQLADIKENSQCELERIYDMKLDDFLKFANRGNIRQIRKNWSQEKRTNNGYTIDYILEFSYFYSLLLTADKMQLIDETPDLPSQKPSFAVEKYKNHVREELLSKNPLLEKSHIFNIREQIFDELKKELQSIDLKSESFFSINIPTGSGKTFLAYYSALYMANKLEKRYGYAPDIVYTLPFLSIIDQNYRELANIVKYNQNSEPKDTEILKYHSLSEIKYESEDKYYENYDARFCFDNWQSKIVTTTFVQLFNTIFKIGNHSIGHRFHRIVNSIIILDEIQEVDEKYYPIIRQFFNKLASEYNVKFIFVTATMPILIDSHELVPNKKTYFEDLNRIKICNHLSESSSLDNFGDLLLEDIEKRPDKSFLIVLNTIKTSKDIFELLQENTDRQCVYLSTEIYPKARLEKIDFIKRSEENLVVVSTQLIEAGVDIDMDVIYRDFCPLDSINQTSGRANRNGKSEEPSEVHLYRLKDENTGYYYHNYIYPPFLIDITQDILKDKNIVEEKDIYSLNEKYAQNIMKKVSHDISTEISKHIQVLDFKKLRNSFELIDNKDIPKHDVIIEADSTCSSIINSLVHLHNNWKENKTQWEYNFEIKNLFRRLNQYKISINNKTYSSLHDSLQEIKGFDVEYLPKNCDSTQLYSEERGIILDNSQIEIF